MSETYERRIPPSDYQSAWFSEELAKIQRALAGVSSATVHGIEAAVAPILYDAVTETVSHAASGSGAGTKGDATHVPRVTYDANGHITGVSEVAIPGVSGVTVQAARLAGDVSTSGGAFVTSLLTRPVVAGESWHCRWVLALGTSVGAAAGISFQILAPTTTGHFGLENGVRSGVAFSQTSSAAPILFATTVANGDFSAAISWAVIDASFYTFTADGIVDLQFKNSGGGETAILRAASALIATKTG